MQVFQVACQTYETRPNHNISNMVPPENINFALKTTMISCAQPWVVPVEVLGGVPSFQNRSTMFPGKKTVRQATIVTCIDVSREPQVSRLQDPHGRHTKAKRLKCQKKQNEAPWPEPIHRPLHKSLLLLINFNQLTNDFTMDLWYSSFYFLSMLPLQSISSLFDWCHFHEL